MVFRYAFQWVDSENLANPEPGRCIDPPALCKNGLIGAIGAGKDGIRFRMKRNSDRSVAGNSELTTCGKCKQTGFTWSSLAWLNLSSPLARLDHYRGPNWQRKRTRHQLTKAPFLLLFISCLAASRNPDPESESDVVTTYHIRDGLSLRIDQIDPKLQGYCNRWAWYRSSSAKFFIQDFDTYSSFLGISRIPFLPDFRAKMFQTSVVLIDSSYKRRRYPWQTDYLPAMERNLCIQLLIHVPIPDIKVPYRVCR
jgi:hypothetical protein